MLKEITIQASCTWEEDQYILNMSHYRALAPYFIPLQIGKHLYNGSKIEVVPIRTMGNGLCYKFHMSNPFPFHNLLQMVISSSNVGTDKLNKVDLFIASENTWQGTIGNGWPYSKIPFSASGAFSTEIVNVINVDLEENIWNYRDGKYNFDDCMNSLHMNKCASIFDSRPLKNL